MTVTCYKNTDDSKKAIKKNLTKLSTKNCIFKDGFSIIEPHLLIEYTSELLKCNYLYIKELSRYYFVNNINLQNGNYMEFDCNADDIMNWQSYLKSKKFYIERQEKTFSSLIVDTQAPSFNDRIQTIKTLGTFGTEPTIYLNTTGGVQ